MTSGHCNPRTKLPTGMRSTSGWDVAGAGARSDVHTCSGDRLALLPCRSLRMAATRALRRCQVCVKRCRRDVSRRNAHGALASRQRNTKVICGCNATFAQILAHSRIGCFYEGLLAHSLISQQHTRQSPLCTKQPSSALQSAQQGLATLTFCRAQGGRDDRTMPACGPALSSPPHPREKPPSSMVPFSGCRRVPKCRSYSITNGALFQHLLP